MLLEPNKYGIGIGRIYVYLHIISVFRSDLSKLLKPPHGNELDTGNKLDYL